MRLWPVRFSIQLPALLRVYTPRRAPHMDVWLRGSCHASFCSTSISDGYPLLRYAPQLLHNVRSAAQYPAHYAPLQLQCSCYASFCPTAIPGGRHHLSCAPRARISSLLCSASCHASFCSVAISGGQQHLRGDPQIPCSTGIAAPIICQETLQLPPAAAPAFIMASIYSRLKHHCGIHSSNLRHHSRLHLLQP